jgi:methylamine---glutamate N-methyltransferase subunit C
VQDGEVLVDKADLVEYRSMRPERAVSSTYDRLFDDPHQDTVEEPFVSEIHALARGGLSGAHGKVAAMGAANWTGGSWSPSGCCRPPRCRSCSPPSKSAAR